MTESTKPQGIFAKSGTRKRVRWFSALVTMGLVLTTGVVVADVVLTYSLQSNVTTTNSSPFSWDQGSNYGTASSLSLVSETCQTGGTLGPSGGPGTCFELSPTVSGVASVPTTLVSAYEFDLTAATAPAAFSAAVTAATGTLALGAGGCAFLYISNVPLTTGSFAYTSSCTVTVTAPAGASNAACGVGVGAGSVLTVNLQGGTSGSTSCAVPNGQASAGLLFVSYYVYVPAANTISGSGSTVSVSMTSS